MTMVRDASRRPWLAAVFVAATLLVRCACAENCGAAPILLHNAPIVAQDVAADGVNLALVKSASGISSELATITIHDLNLSAYHTSDPVRGTVVAVDGKWLLAGQPESASVHVFANNTLHQTLKAPQGFEGSRFGASVAISGDVLIVGSPSYRNEQSFAVIYRQKHKIWVPEATLNAPHGVENFGTAVDIRSQVAAVAAPGIFSQGTNLKSTGPEAAAVFVYRKTSHDFWKIEQKLEPMAWDANQHPIRDSLSPSISFGSSISFGAANKLLVGHQSASQAQVFAEFQETWSLEAILRPPKGIGRDFGSAVSLSVRGEALVSAPKSRKVFVYERESFTPRPAWTLQATLESESLGFGTALVLGSSGIALVTSLQETFVFAICNATVAASVAPAALFSPSPRASLSSAPLETISVPPAANFPPFAALLSFFVFLPCLPRRRASALPADAPGSYFSAMNPQGPTNTSPSGVSVKPRIPSTPPPPPSQRELQEMQARKAKANA